MGRSGRYDDLNDNKVSRREGSSSKILLAVILVSILICAIAVLCWVKILETQDMAKAAKEAANPKPETETSVQETAAAATATAASAPQDDVILAPTVSEKLSAAANPLDLTIDSALTSLQSSEKSDIDYISSTDFHDPDSTDAPVVEEGVEMKKQVIAQNLSKSQQPVFSKDLVNWQEYKIKQGDSLTDIATSFGLDVQTLISVNQIKSVASLWIGSTLRIPDRDGTLYIVKEGDTLSSIISQFSLGISARALGDVNGIMDDSLQVGQELFIPYDTIESSGTITQISFTIPDGLAVAMYNQKVADPSGNGSLQLDGIVIQNQAGAPVTAAESGTVVDKGFNDNGTGFVKIMHANGYTTYYDFLGDICVEPADNVEKGQKIGVFVQDGTYFGHPVVFFRIEQGGIAFDPYSF